MNRSLATRVLPCLLLLLSLLTGCDSNAPEENDTPPPVIPSEAFTIQTELFAGSASKAAGAHFINAALRVWPASLALSAHLIVPAVVTAAALDAGEPALENGTFIWTSTAQTEQNNLSFSLSGKPEGSYIDWTMRIQWTNPDTDETEEFTLFTAQTDPNSKSGTWSLYYPFDGTPLNVLNAEYAITSETKKEIEFSIPEGVETYAGSTVRYSQDGDVRTFYWFQSDENQTHTISWNQETKVGSIISTSYNDGEKACWGPSLEDIPCTP